jgi:hypothetical protein
MYPSVSLGDTERRDLAADDQQGVCDIYPFKHESCIIPTDGGGCATLASASSSSGRPGRGVAAFVTTGMAAALFWLAFRRRAKRS